MLKYRKNFMIGGFAAVVMAASCMGIGASAAYPTATSSQQSGSLWKITTSVSVANVSVSATGSGYYYVSRTMGSDGYYTYATAATANGNGSSTSGVTCYLSNPKKHGFYTIESTHKANGYTTKTLSKQGTYVS